MSVLSPRSGSGSRAPSPRRTLTAPAAEPESFYPRIPPRRSLSTAPPEHAADGAAHDRHESGSQVDELEDEPTDADLPPRSRSTLPLRVTRRGRALSNAAERPNAPRRATSGEMPPSRSADDERAADLAPPHSANSTASGMSTSRSAPNVEPRGAPPPWSAKANSASPPLVPDRKRAHRPSPLDARALHESSESMPPLARHLSQSPRYADWPQSAPGGPTPDQRRLPPMLNEPSGSRPMHHLPSSSAAAREQAQGRAGPRSLPGSPRPLQRSPHEQMPAAPRDVPAEDADLQPEEVDKFLALIEKHNLDASDEEDMARSVTELYQEWLEWCALRGTLSTKSKPALVSEFVRIHQGAYGPERRQRALGIVQGSRHNSASNGREELGPALTAAAIHPGVGGPRRRQMPPTPFDGKPRYADEPRSNGAAQGASRTRMGASPREANVTLSGDWRRTEARPHEQAAMRRPAGPQSHPSYGPEPGRAEHMHPEPSPPGVANGKSLPPGLFDMMRADILQEARAMILHELTEHYRELTAQNRALVARVEQLEKQSDNAAQWIQHLSRAQEDLSASHAQASHQQQQAQAQAQAAQQQQQQHEQQQQQLHHQQQQQAQQQAQQQRQEQQHREAPHPSPRYASAAPAATHPAYAHHPHNGPPRGAYGDEYESPPRRHPAHPAAAAALSGPSGSNGALPPPRYGNGAPGPDARRPRGPEYEVEAGGPYADERAGMSGAPPHVAAQQQPRRMPPAPQYYPGAHSPAGEAPPHHAAQHPAAAARSRMPEPRDDPRRLAPFAGSPSAHPVHDERMAKRPRNGYF